MYLNFEALWEIIYILNITPEDINTNWTHYYYDVHSIVGQDLSGQLSNETGSIEEDKSEEEPLKSGETSKDNASTPLNSQEGKLPPVQFQV